MFEKEIKVFERNRSRFLKESPGGGFVIIYKDKIIGYADTRNDALKIGYDELGERAKFLVRDIQKGEEKFTFANILSFNVTKHKPD
jgi:hypothetical protein